VDFLVETNSEEKPIRLNKRNFLKLF